MHDVESVAKDACSGTVAGLDFTVRRERESDILVVDQTPSNVLRIRSVPRRDLEFESSGLRLTDMYI